VTTMESNGPRAGKLEAVGISMRYHQRRLDRWTSVLDDVSVTVRPREFVTLIGPSGCGKTTFLHILDGLLTPTGGTVRVDDRVVTGPGPERAMVFQEAALLPWRTVLGNIAYGAECLGWDRARALRSACHWLEVVGLRDVPRHYPHELSGGMRQRVNLARALTVEPRILLMDEPFSSVDAQTREMLQAELMAIFDRTETTVLFVTHDIAEAIYLADRVVVLSRRPARIQEIVEVDLPRPRDRQARRSRWLRDCEDYLRGLLRPHAPTASDRAAEPMR
jgi:NitT/TauT family transport system ATP-binding protein